jgi:hypothetical protein
MSGFLDKAQLRTLITTALSAVEERLSRYEKTIDDALTKVKK